MLNASKDLVVVNMSGTWDWDRGVVNRNFFVVRELLARKEFRKILLVDFPPFSAKTALREYLRAKMYRAGSEYRSCGLRVMKKTAGAREYFVLQTTLSWNRPARLTQQLVNVLSHLKFERPLLWSFDPLSYHLFPPHLFSHRIFDAVDNWLAHPSFLKYRIPLSRNYHEIANSASTIFMVSKNLLALFRKHQNCHWIPNGIDAALTQKLLQQPLKPSAELPFPRPWIGYMGILQGRIDFDLIKKIAQALPKHSFIFVGPIWPMLFSRFRPKAPEIQECEKLPNVHFLGRLPFSKGLAWIRQCDAVMIPHKQDDLTSSMNPMKLYEALALGKPVIATPIAGLELFSGLVSSANNPESFAAAIQSALVEDRPDKQYQRIQAVRGMTWTARVEEMMQNIG